MKSKTSFELGWSLIAWAIASALDLWIYFVLTNVFSVDYIISTIVWFIAWTILNYELNRKFVFSNSKYWYKSWLVIFSIIWLVWLLVSTLVMWLMVEKLNFNKNISRIWVYFLVFFLNFFLRKKFIF